jgi:hypothetical protein
MIEASSRKRALIVGAGQRVQNNFLPAFRCLSDLFELCGIHSRTTERLGPVADRWSIPPLTSLAGADLSGVDLIAISVPTAENEGVLRQLLPHAEHLRILIDTPIAWTLSERERVEPILRQFAGVTVAEDYMNFPAFSLLRDAVRQGVVGRPRSLSLFNIGYLYHGLALIRSFEGFAPATGSWRQPLGSHATAVGYRFDSGFMATVVGPYRRHEPGGGLLLEGANGFITEAAIDVQCALAGKPTYVLEATRSGGELSGYRLSGHGFDLSVDAPYLAAMRAMDIADKSELNLIRGCGLIEVIRSVFHARNINRQYGYRNALYDSIVSQRADKGETPLDPIGILPGNGRRSRWRANEDTFLKMKTAAAATLADDQKVSIRPADLVDAERHEFRGDHTALFGVRLNEKPLPAEAWHLYSPAWNMLN